MTITRVILLALIACSLTACGSRIQQLRDAGFDIDNHVQTGDVEFKVTGGGNSLSIDNSPNRRCDNLTGKKKFKRGCFELGTGEQGLFTFKFKQPQDADDYYFAAFQLCQWSGGDAAPDRSSCVLKPRQRRDFSIEFGSAIVVPDADGKVDLTVGGARVSRFEFWTSNVQALDYFYWVDVCPVAVAPGDSSCLSVDPGSRNNGVRN